MAQNPFSGLFDEETKQQQEQESGRVSVSQSEPSQTKTPDNPFSGLFAEEKAQAPAPVQSVQQPAQAAEPEKKKDGGVFGFLSKAYDVVQTAGNIAFGKINIDPEKGYQGYQRGTDVAAEKLGETKFIKEVAEAQVTLESLEAQGEYTPTFRDNLGMNVLRTAAAAGGDVKWAMNTDTGKEIIKKVEGGTSNLPLKGVAVLRSFGKETYDEAYKAMLEDRENPENGAFKSFLYELQDSGTQSMVGVLLALGATAATRNPKAGLAISSPYYAALSGAEQIESKGEVYSSTNIGIDVVGDQILNAALTGIFRQPTTALGRIATDFGIEGTTEVSQSLLKFSNDYANAQSDEEREAILNDAKQYVTSGAIAMEFFVGATVGAIAGAGTEVMSKKSTPTDKKDEAPTQEDTKNPLGKAGEIIAKQQRGEELTQEEVAIAQQAQERFIDYSNTFGERTVYFPETNQNGTSISVEVLPLGDGKFATAYSATAGDVAINVAYDLNETFTSEKEATNQALERIAQWVDTQKVRTDLDPVVVGRLEDIAQKAKKPEPKKLTVKKVEEVPPMKQPETAPVVDSKRKEIDARASRSAKGKPTKKVGAETKKKPVLPSSKKKEAERATKDLPAGWQATAQDSIYYKPGKDGQEPIKIFALNDNAERDGTFRVQGNGVMVKEGGKDKLFGSLDDALRFANSNESVLRNLEDDQNATDATTQKEKVEVTMEEAEQNVVNALKKRYPDGVTLYHQTSNDAKKAIDSMGFAGEEVYFSLGGFDKKRGTASDNAQVIEVFVPVSEYVKIGIDRGSYEGDSEAAQYQDLADAIAEGEKNLDVTLLREDADALLDAKTKRPAQKRSEKTTKGNRLTKSTYSPVGQVKWRELVKISSRGSRPAAVMLDNAAGTSELIFMESDQAHRRAIVNSLKKVGATQLDKPGSLFDLIAKPTGKDYVAITDPVNVYLYTRHKGTKIEYKMRTVGFMVDGKEQYFDAALLENAQRYTGETQWHVRKDGRFAWLGADPANPVAVVSGTNKEDESIASDPEATKVAGATLAPEKPKAARPKLTDAEALPSERAANKVENVDPEKAATIRTQAATLTIVPDTLQQEVELLEAEGFSTEVSKRKAKEQKSTIFGKKDRPTQVVQKSKVKDLLMGEDRIIMTVQITPKGDKVLTYTEAPEWDAEPTSSFTLIPEALGLVSENLQEFQEVVLDASELKQAGTKFKLVDSDGNVWGEPVDNANEFQLPVWHGSGAMWDTPDLSFIGSGEGAQAFGWGFYVTEVEGIGRDYQRRLSGMNNDTLQDRTERIMVDGKSIWDWLPKSITSVLSPAFNDRVYADYGDWTQARSTSAKELRDILWSAKAEAARKQQRALDAIRVIEGELDSLKAAAKEDGGWSGGLEEARAEKASRLNIARIQYRNAADFVDEVGAMWSATSDDSTIVHEWDMNRGYLYELEIDDKAADTYLLWDEPMSKQPKVVQSALNKYVDEIFEGDQVYKDEYAKTLNGVTLYNMIGSELNKKQENLRDQQEAASKWLLAQGVRGIKYKTGSTRNKNKWLVKHPQGGINEFNSQADAERFVNGQIARQNAPTGSRYKKSDYVIDAPRADYNLVSFDTNDITVIARNGERLTIVEEDPNEMSEVLRPQYGGKVPGRYDQEMVNKAQRWLAQAGRSNRVALLTPKFVAWMKKHRIGVRELEGDYSLFRTGRINPGQVQSFSILNNGWDGTEQYFVPKESVVLNFASNEYVDVLRNTFWGKDLELALESHAAWMDREGGEVLVEAPEAGLRPVNAKQPRDDAGRYLPFETIEQEVGDTFEEVAKRVQKAESDTTRPSRFLPRTPEGSQPFGDLTIDQKKLDRNDNVEVKKLVRRSEIAKELAERLNIVIRRGKMRQQATGVYKKKQKVIRLSQKYQNERFGGEITTLFHEIGHFIDFAVQPMRGLIPKNEVMPLLKEYGGGGETVSPPKRRPEAFAEFLRYYMTDPKKAKDRAPKFFEIFEQTMEKYPDVYAPIQDAKKQFAMWADQPPVARQMARIGYGDIKTGSRFARLGKKIKVLAHRGYTSFVNRIHPIDQFSELYKKLEGGDIASRQDPGLLAQNMNGWIGLAQHFLEYGTIKRSWYQEAQKGKVGTVKVEGKPLKEILLPIDKLDAMREFSAYLVSRRDIELGAREITTGATAGDAEATIEYLERKFPAFKQAAEELDTYQTSLLDMLVEYGVLDPAMKKTMQDMNKMYVPFYRVQEEITQKDFMGRTLQSKNPIKKIKGSQRDIADPIDSIIKNTYTFANLARRNEVMQAFALGAEKHPDLGTLFERVPGDMAKVATVDAKDIAYKAFGADSEFAKNFLPTEVQMFIEMVMPEKLVPIFRPTFSQQGDVVTVLDGGKAKHYYVDRDLYEAIEGMNIDQAGFYMNLFAFPAQTLRAGATLTPEFMARNPMRDTFVAGIQTKHGFRLGFDTVRGLASLLKKDDAYKAWLIEGGNLSSLVSMDRKQLAETQKTLLRRSERMKNLVKNPLEVLQILSAAMEQATRIGEARRALIKGEDPKQAARAAREISSDFLRMGSKIIPMSRVTAFFNVRVQGIDKMYRTFKDQPFKATAQSVLRITLPSIILYMINRDEEGWEEIPQWQKDVFWLVPIPRQFAQNIPGLVTEEQGENVWLRIPKPFEYGLVFGSLPERFMEYLDKKDPEKMDEVFRTLRTSFLPLPIPTGALPIMENWFNYSIFLDRPIIPRGKENLPAEDQYTDGTSEIAKIAGDAINYSPAKIDNLLYGYFAGLGRYATESVDSVLKGTGIVSVPPEPAATPSEIPVQKAFVVRAPIGSGSNSVETFYRRREEATVAHNKINMLLESGQTAEAREYLAEHPEAKLYTSYNRVAKKMGEIRAAKDRIYQSETMSPEEKRKKLDKLDSIMTELAYRSVNIELK